MLPALIATIRMEAKTDMLYVKPMFNKVKYWVLLPLLMAISGSALSQSMSKNIYFWKLHSVTGEARLLGLYREQERIGTGIDEYQKSAYLSGGLLIRTNSSFIHPNFLTLDLDAGYFPSTSRDNFIVVPDQAEVRTLKKLDIGAAFFKQKNTTINLFGNFDESYSTRENLTDIKSINKHYGGIFGYSNKFLPLTIDVHKRSWKEVEIQTGRQYTLDQTIFGARLSKSFSSRDKSELRYSHDENVNINQNLFRVSNTVDNIDFTSHINLDAKQKYNLNTLISNFNQRGFTTLQRFQASEFMNFQLPANLTLFGNYNYYNINFGKNKLIQHSVNTSLQHQLYKSLRSSIHFDYNKINHTVYQEFNTKSGFELNYTKKIPTGQVLISYRYDRYHQDYKSDPVDLNITSEQYVLADNKIILLRIPDVKLASVAIKDSTGTLVYMNGLDYILIETGKYIEIRRIPGGAIANNTVVLVDYTATQPGAYKYDANSHAFNAGVYLLNNLISVYYRFVTQDYTNLEKTEFVTLNYFTQNLVGCRLEYKYISAGVEYDNYQSSILPYRMMRYYLNFQKNYGRNLSVMLNGNMQDYVMLDEAEPKYQKYMDVTGRVIYTLYRQTTLNAEMMYRKQTGRGIDLDLLTAKTEVTSIINRLSITLGLELYRRNYIGEQINFKGAYFKLVRKF